MIEQFLRDPDFSPLWRWLAWLAHLYTAVGLVLAAGIGVCIARGGSDDFRWAFGLMVVACLVDATDGSLARRLRVKEVLPHFDGSKLDDLIDFLTFTFLPLALVWRAELLPDAAEWVLVLALVASAYGFCQIPAKTTDGYFVGFPSYWNIVAFYLYMLAIPGWIAAGLVFVLALLTFVPSYYMYPSRGGTLSRLTSFLGGVWVVLLFWILWKFGTIDSASDRSAPSNAHVLTLVSLFFPVYYMFASWGLSVLRWMRARDAQKEK